MTVEITDCTIRDGGYLLNKQSNPEFVREILKNLSIAGIEYVETGFLQSKVSPEDTIVYHDSKDISKYLPQKKGKTNFLGFCDNSRYSIDDLDDYNGRSFKWLRISFGKHEIDTSVDFCKKAQDKGYIIQFNPMDAIGYSDNEWETLISKVNKVSPGSLSIVDTFGAMHLNDLIHIYKNTDNLLNKDIKIGLHSHDNLGLSNALGETLASLSSESNRDVIIDGSLFGMGRGAGNARTELVADFLNSKYGSDYKIDVLLNTIEKYIIPLRDRIQWGYDLSMFVCGSMHAHVDNVAYMKKQNYTSSIDYYHIIKYLSPANRTRYGVDYKKDDFGELKKVIDKYRYGGEL